MASPRLPVLMLCTALLWSGSAHADPYGRRDAGMGGGFLEMLMTGRDPTPGRSVAYGGRPMRPMPYGQPPMPYGQPMADPYAPPPPRYAALPQGSPLQPIERGFDPRFEKQQVEYDGPHGPGTIIVDTPNKYLFLVQPGRTALRYGIGVGRPGFTWSGVKSVTRKAEWPNWTPPSEMLKRRPDLPRFMEGGPDNPLGARALYLGSSLYRIHGTNEPHTIGTNVSSGCIRLRNEDVMDLYNRVRVGARVVVI